MTLAATVLVCWTAVAMPIRVIDGDTFTARIPIWHGLFAEETIRVAGIDTPEKKHDREAWERAKAFTQAWLEQADNITIYTCRRDGFGRVISYVTRQKGTVSERLDKALAERQLGTKIGD